MMSSCRRLAGLALLFAAGCQHDVTTLFPPGLEPLADDPEVQAVAAPVAEALVMTNTQDTEVHVYGRGYVFAPVATVWAAAQDPLALIATCNTDAQAITQQDETGYALDFSVHYTVNNILTVGWDDQYRGAVISVGVGSSQVLGMGIPGDVVSRTMIEHQKTMGSSFISVSEGTTQLLANADNSVTEVQMIEHLKAVEQPLDQVTNGMRHEFDSLLAIAHGGAVPACP